MAAHVPLRRCVGCGRVAPKTELVRLASVSHGQSGRARVMIDPGGELPGRGAYICREQPAARPRRECLVLAERRKAFARAFRQAVDVPAELQAGH